MNAFNHHLPHNCILHKYALNANNWIQRIYTQHTEVVFKGYNDSRSYTNCSELSVHSAGVICCNIPPIFAQDIYALWDSDEG